MNFFAILGTMFAGDIIFASVAWRLLGALRRSWPWRAVLVAFAVLQGVGLAMVLLHRTGGLAVDTLLAKPVVAAIYLWHLCILPIFLVCAIVAAVVFVIRALVRIAAQSRPVAAPVEPRGVSRRQFLAASAAAAPAVLCTIGVGVAAPQLERFRIRRLAIALPQLPRALDGLRIAHVSDTHVGRFTSGAILERIAAATDSLAADLVLFTGDLINYDLRDLPAAIELIRGMRARHGVFLCEGNHDLIEDGAAFARGVKDAGLHLLLGETATLRIRDTPVQILGSRWGWRTPHGSGDRDLSVRRAVEQMLPLRDPGAFPILLAHHPHAFDFAENIPLTLAGHTHGGQLMLTPQTGFGPAMYRYWSGLYRREDRAVVVSNGVGNWFPLRSRAPAEIVEITLHASPK